MLSAPTSSPNDREFMTQTFYSHGKLLLTGEYLVLDGAQALAVPTKKGQWLKVAPLEEKEILWQSLDLNGNPWLSLPLPLNDITAWDLSKDPKDEKQRLLQILASAKAMNPLFLGADHGARITTRLEFPRHWGLGSSSTLITNVAAWAEVDAYALLQKSFGGSGYDIACAKNDRAVLYKLKNGKPKVASVDFNPSFAESLFFVYLNQKQNSRDAIQHYRQQPKRSLAAICRSITQISQEILISKSLEDFEKLVGEHENLLSKALNLPTVKDRLFPGFSGGIKSLGGWGGDFIMALGTPAMMNYFRNRGYSTIIPFNEMVYTSS